eukprot:TRINITY_DN25178_c0_g1_i1.p1 TRINITY_DN25178_c0_g1~~TRINITY_DN25178_c0_g1_i1.p1  ORF type:complete len:771 (-),score=256.66 TRINITY_DN25178_c0_g1_i1:123-2390(-)
MTVDLGRPLEREEHFVGDKRFLIASVKDSLVGEKFTDCVLVTKEGIPVPVHRMVLTPSPFLKTLLLSTSCCRGLCSHASTTTIMLPDVSYRQLDILLGFFYTGMINCTSSEMDIVKDLLVNVFFVPRNTVMLHKKDGHTDCAECGQHVPIARLLEHLVTDHVEKPCVKDMARVEGGDSRAVSCSQHGGNKACDIDLEKTRISNGIFNYVGQEDPVSCVVDHYRKHFDNMVQFVRKEHPSFVIPLHMNLRFDEVKLRQLARTSSSHLLEPSSVQVNWNTRAEVDKFLHQSTAPDSSSTPTRPGQPPASPPPSAATPPTSHSGGLSSPEEDLSDKAAKVNSVKPQKPQDKVKTRRKKSMLSSSDSSSDGFSDPYGSASVGASGKYFQLSKKPGGHSQNMFRNNSHLEPIKPLGISNNSNKNILKSKTIVHTNVDISSAGSSSIFNPLSVGSSSSSGSSGSSNKRKLSEEDNSNITSNTNTTTSNIVSTTTTTTSNNPPAKKQRTSTSGQRTCKVCRKQHLDSQFARHVTTHLYQLWPEVERTAREHHCSLGCIKQLESWKNLVLHLATHHNQLETKLGSMDQTLSDYEMDDTEETGVGLGEIGGMSTIAASSAREVLARHDLSPDHFREDRTSPKIAEPLASLNISQNPLLDSSQDDAMVIVENGDEDVDVNELLDDSQDDPDIFPAVPALPKVLATPTACSPIIIDTSQSDSDAATVQEIINGLDSPVVKKDDDADSDATAPWEGEGDRMKEVEEG